MVLDVHCHIVPPEIARDPAAFGQRDLHFDQMRSTKGVRFLTGEDLLRDMASDGVDKAVACGFSFKDLGVSRLQNDYALSVAKMSGGSVVALAVLDPESPGAMAEAERCLAAGACGFGELFPAGHGFSLEGEGMSRLAALAQEAGVPLLIHVNEQIGHQYPGKGHVGAEEAYRFSARNPGVTSIFAHLGGGLPFYASMPEVLALENTYYDTAAQPYLFKPEVYRSLSALGISGKILLGSDYPLVSCARYIKDIGKAGLRPYEVQGILSENALGIFGKFFT
ncbi:MAG: amidohydrolase family protein [Bacillota bacterium]